MCNVSAKESKSMKKQKFLHYTLHLQHYTKRLYQVVVCALLSSSGCTTMTPEEFVPPTQAIPVLQGSYHQVRRGETLWRIAHSYGLDVRTLASVNRLPHAARLSVGQRLYVPLPAESGQFLWPLRGSLRSTNTPRGVEITAPAGSLARASRSGRVAVATQHLSGWGKTVVVDHLDGYFTIYSGLGQILVSPGVNLRQGTPVGSIGSRALHFEIRYGAVPKDTLALLPRE